MGHWLLHISAPSACVPPSSQLFFLSQSIKNNTTGRDLKHVTNMSKVGWIGWFLVILFGSNIVEKFMDGHTLCSSCTQLPKCLIDKTSQYWSTTGLDAYRVHNFFNIHSCRLMDSQLVHDPDFTLDVNPMHQQVFLKSKTSSCIHLKI